MRARSYFVSILKCSVCGNTMYVPRKKDEKRGVGHIKTMYCPYCKKKQDFVEKGEH